MGVCKRTDFFICKKIIYACIIMILTIRAGLSIHKKIIYQDELRKNKALRQYNKVSQKNFCIDYH